MHSPRWIALLLLLSPPALAAPLLPYGQRTIGYSGWSDSVHGDIPNVGMAGATVGLALSFVGCLDNPAGLGMTLASPGIQITSNTVHDGQVQNFENGLETNMV